jgi:hypothetical protein
MTCPRGGRHLVQPGPGFAIADHEQAGGCRATSRAVPDSGRNPSISRNDSGRPRSLHHRAKLPERSEVNTSWRPSGAMVAGDRVRKMENALDLATPAQRTRWMPK